MKLNNKGFAITGFLYSTFAIFLVILSLILISMTNSKLTLDKIKKDIKNKLDDPSTEGNLYEKLFSYTGNVQTFIVPYSGWYKIELWGAQGGSSSTTYIGGKGTYTNGKIFLSKGEKIYIYIGGQGTNCLGETLCDGGYNGGGDASAMWSSNASATRSKSSGGGSTDIRYFNDYQPSVEELKSDSQLGLKFRIMTAAGGGGGTQFAYNNLSSKCIGAIGGDLIGVKSQCTLAGINESTLNIATQISAGNSVYNESNTSTASFGTGSSGFAGGGGGYYGGAGGYGYNGGGSSFISGYAGVNAITSSSSLTPTNNTIHYSGKYFINGTMTAGSNNGNGKAKITYLSETKPNRVNAKLNNVRYIKDCMNGNSDNTSNQWTEIQAIKNGENMALNKLVIGTVPVHSNVNSKSYTTIVNGDIIDTGLPAQSSVVGLQCVTVDLGITYDLDEIAIWHSIAYGRTYNDNITFVSSDNTNWIEVINKIEAETSNGKRVSAYNE